LPRPPVAGVGPAGDQLLRLEVVNGAILFADGGEISTLPS